MNEEDNIRPSECYNKTSSNSKKIINTKYISTAQDTQSKYISHHHGQPNDVNHLKTDLTNEARIVNNNNVNNDKSNLYKITNTTNTTTNFETSSSHNNKTDLTNVASNKTHNVTKDESNFHKVTHKNTDSITDHHTTANQS